MYAAFENHPGKYKDPFGLDVWDYVTATGTLFYNMGSGIYEMGEQTVSSTLDVAGVMAANIFYKNIQKEDIYVKSLLGTEFQRRLLNAKDPNDIDNVFTKSPADIAYEMSEELFTELFWTVSTGTLSAHYKNWESWNEGKISQTEFEKRFGANLLGTSTFALGTYASIKTPTKKIALGRWENEETFWIALVDKRKAYHLSTKGSTPSRQELALGQKVFANIAENNTQKLFQEIVITTEKFLMQEKKKKILFDLTNISSASKVPSIPTRGYFARQELIMILSKPELFQKTSFFLEGKPLWRHGIFKSKGTEKLLETMLEEVSTSRTSK